MRGLYAIVDPDACAGRDPAWVADRLLSAPIGALQIRAKRATDRALLALARTLRDMTRRAGVPLIVNDRVDVALAVEADGVHLGQTDLPVSVVRAIAPALQVGVSTHCLEQALRAADEGADAIAFGPVFPTRSKQNPDPVVGLDALATVVARVRLPVIAIGGIDASRVAAVRATGASAWAAIGALCGAADPQAAARSMACVE
ncbi:MAG: thiamine phosphate synthase [Myxococcota bacterium]|nr:thiamine phosphate synthase [Myxococcota bacterium]MDW8362078.1 thiamine phosphate synthase [Myxococcales bacterium]